MEVLIAIAVIFVLLFCLGISTEIIIKIAVGIVCLMILFMAVVFIYASVIMICGKKVNGFFSGADNEDNGKIPYARYMIDGEEYRNLFPLETIVRKKIYTPDKEVKLILNKKAKRCMDKNAVVCCILGLTVSVILIVCICLLYKIVL